MPSYLKYPVLALFAGAVIYFTASVVQAIATPGVSEIDVESPRAIVAEPNYLITDANNVPPR